MGIFGEPPIDSCDLVRELIRGLSEIVTLDSSTDFWTSSVKEVLRKLGKKTNRAVAPDPDNPRDKVKGFLLDFLWWKDGESNDVVLAVESEWGKDKEIFHDFGKLLSIKAPLKVMIYGTSKHGMQSSPIRQGIENSYMKRFTQHVVGEKYLLIEVDAPEKNVFAYEFLVLENGRLEEVVFSEILVMPWSFARVTPNSAV
jgi:hypothetical protein